MIFISCTRWSDQFVPDSQDTLLECESPFLVKLHGTSQDDVHIYMMMEAVMGGELFRYLQVIERPIG